VLSDSTIQAAHRLLRTALQDAVGVDNILVENVARNVRLSYRYRPKFQAWSASEARSFLRVADQHRLGALFTAALLLGVRRGEALGLAWVDVDLDRGVLRVRQALQRAGGVLRLGPVKSDGSARFVAMPTPCVEAFRRHRERQDAEGVAAGPRWHDSGLVFTTPIGTPMEPANVNKIFAGLCTRSGVRHIRFHDLRHSCATLLYELGVPIENIQDVLGHSTRSSRSCSTSTALRRCSGLRRTGWARSSRAWTNDVGVRLGSRGCHNRVRWLGGLVLLSI
jgi:integrase